VGIRVRKMVAVGHLVDCCTLYRRYSELGRCPKVSGTSSVEPLEKMGPLRAREILFYSDLPKGGLYLGSNRKGALKKKKKSMRVLGL